MKTIAAIVLFCLAAAVPASAELGAKPYVMGLAFPLAFVQDPGDRTVQYVVEQGGLIKVIKHGALSAVPFLDLTSSVSCCGERGLLGLAFRPDYATSGRFFVNFTNPQGNTVVARFRRSAANALVADPTSRFDLQWPSGVTYIVQPYSNHNGGTIAFGPDGYLYIGMGDGGSSDDPEHRAQDPAQLLGKILRINVTVPDTDIEGYDIPADNPFLDNVPVPALGEIWDFGVRNPWKFSFDDPTRGGTGALVIADVGQGAYEEVDYEPSNRGGRNYGWRNREGAHVNPTVFDPALPPAYTPLTDPIYEYTHADGISITGGYVYRGAALGLAHVGRYFFADLTGRVWSIGLTIDPGTGEATATGVVEHTAELGGKSSLGFISSFGTDGDGELYVVGYSNGIIFKLVSNPSDSGSDVVMDLGSRGLWARYNDGTNALLTKASPIAIASADIDASGKADVIAAFQGIGVWVRWNDAQWRRLNPVDAAAITTGDLDGNGRSDVVIDFPGDGLWALMNNTAWFRLSTMHPTRMVTADLDGNGRSELIVNFPGHGLWAWSNNTSWVHLATSDVSAMAAGDLDGNGQADLMAAFPGRGLWLLSNNSTWAQLQTQAATVMTIGDVDGNGKADAFVTFPGLGVWVLMNNASWSRLHPFDATVMGTADTDGTGRADVVVTFAGWGVWEFRNNTDWVQLRTQDAEALTFGNLDGI